MPQLDFTIFNGIYLSFIISFVVIYILIVYRGLSYLILRQLIISNMKSCKYIYMKFCCLNLNTLWLFGCDCGFRTFNPLMSCLKKILNFSILYKSLNNLISFQKKKIIIEVFPWMYKF